MTDEKAPTAPEIREATIKDRVVRVRMPNPTQLALIRSTINRVQRMGVTAENMDRAMDAVGRCLDVLQALLVADADRAWVEELMLTGQLEIQDLGVILQVWREDQTEQPRRVRRARA